MRKQSIALPDQNLSKVVAPSTSAPQQLIHLTILSPEVVDDPGSSSRHLQGVSITLPKGMVVSIGEISPVDLASLICHIGQ